PLFPGYLFSQFSINTHYRAVHYAQGVRGVVAFGDVPAEMDEESIIFIKSRIINDFVDMDQLHFSHGQTVRICEGPFQGLEAIFEREITSQQRVVLLLNALAQKTPVVVDREYVTVV
ncbi:MAG: hypothetical protein ACE5FU_10040, partial [Nitrospinota bacterium]